MRPKTYAKVYNSISLSLANKKTKLCQIRHGLAMYLKSTLNEKQITEAIVHKKTNIE